MTRIVCSLCFVEARVEHDHRRHHPAHDAGSRVRGLLRAVAVSRI